MKKIVLMGMLAFFVAGGSFQIVVAQPPEVCSDNSLVRSKVGPYAGEDIANKEAESSRVILEQRAEKIRGLLGSYSIFLDWLKERTPNSAEESLSALREAKNSFTSGGREQALSVFTQECAKGNYYALPFIVANLSSFRDFMPKAFPVYLDHHWKIFSVTIKNIFFAGDPSKTAGFVNGVIEEIRLKIPNTYNFRDIKVYRGYLDLAKGLLNLDHDDIARSEVLEWICGFLNYSDVPLAERIGFFNSPGVRSLIMETRNDLHNPVFSVELKQRLVYLQSFFCETFFNGHIPFNGTPEEKYSAALGYMRKTYANAPDQFKPLVGVFWAYMATGIMQEFPKANFPLEEKKHWVSSIFSVVKERNGLYKNLADVVLRAVQSLETLLDFNDIDGSNYEMLREVCDAKSLFDLEIKNLQLHSSLDQKNNEHVDLKIKYLCFQEYCITRSSETLALIKKIAPKKHQKLNSQEFLSYLIRSIIQNPKSKEYVFYQSTLINAGSLAREGFLTKDLNGRNIQSANKSKAAAEYFLMSKSDRGKQMIFQMLTTDEIQYSDISQGKGEDVAIQILESVKEHHDYYRAIYILHQAKKTQIYDLVEVLRALTVLNSFENADFSEKHIALAESLIFQKVYGLHAKQNVELDKLDFEESNGENENSLNIVENAVDPFETPKKNRCITPFKGEKSADRVRRLVSQNRINQSPISPISFDRLENMKVELGELVQDEFDQHDKYGQQAILQTIDSVQCGEALRGMETLKGKSMKGVPHKMLEMGLVKAVPIYGNHRLVYSQHNGVIKIYRCYGHYDDLISGLNN